ncbi:MAG: acyl-CoA thioester hydrolase/BAAT C-terminal domain-containing protein [Dokdonia sp.]|jgi:dienelactone hydrolase|nr:palmitoyl-CoA hydrolase [Cytophagaceae bacterium]
MKKKMIMIVGIVALFMGGYFVLDNMLYTGVRPEAIETNGFRANFYAQDDTSNETTLILIGGGQWGDYWGHEVAQRGMVGLSLPYLGKKELPILPEEIDLVYFENAITWLREQPEVNPDKIVVMGASRNAELALILATSFTETVSGVIAYAPSSVSWSNTVLPYNSNKIKASWTYKGSDIAYVPMDKIAANAQGDIDFLSYWRSGLAKKDFVEKASIKVENIKGPILLFSGKDDLVWPSSEMANSIENRLEEEQFEYDFENIKYDEAGHLISTNPDDRSRMESGSITIDDKEYAYTFGGTADGDYSAKQDAKNRVITFLTKL